MTSVKYIISNISVILLACFIGCSDPNSSVPVVEDLLDVQMEPVDMFTKAGTSTIVAYDWELNGIRILFHTKENGFQLGNVFEKESQARAPFDIEATADGGSILSGFLGIYAGPTEWIYLMRLNAQGDSLWSSKTQILYGYFKSQIVSSCNNKYWLAVRPNWDDSPWIAQVSEVGKIGSKRLIGLKFISDILPNNCGYVAIGSNYQNQLTFVISNDNGEPAGSVILLEEPQSYDPYTIKIERASDGYLVTGKMWGTNSQDVFIQKLTQTGELVWNTVITSSNGEPVSVYENDSCYIIVAASPNVGSTLDPVTIRVYKVNFEGKLENDLKIADNLTSVRATTLDESGNLLILGTKETNHETISMFLLEVDVSKL